MKYGICKLNSIAIRLEPSDKSEMVSQLLFGETCEILDTQENWHLIRCDFDHYEGWIHQLNLHRLEEESYVQLKVNNTVVSSEFITFIHHENNGLQTISLGASLPNFSNGKFNIENTVYSFDGTVNKSPSPKSALVKTAYSYLNTPFLWGGRTPFGIDCSGFTQMVYKINGYTLLRDAVHQASQGEVLSFIEESEPGDLAFFDNEEGEIVHVGIILANNYIIHCHGKVRIDRIDHSGIYNVDTKRHTHKLRVMKQLF